MTDLEITKLCAEAMGYLFESVTPAGAHCYMPSGGVTFNPLHDDAQAMALVKKWCLFISFSRGKWTVSSGIGGHDKTGAQYTNLNHAICECVAKIQLAKSDEKP